MSHYLQSPKVLSGSQRTDEGRCQLPLGGLVRAGVPSSKEEKRFLSFFDEPLIRDQAGDVQSKESGVVASVVLVEVIQTLTERL